MLTTLEFHTLRNPLAHVCTYCGDVLPVDPDLYAAFGILPGSTIMYPDDLVQVWERLREHWELHTAAIQESADPLQWEDVTDAPDWADRLTPGQTFLTVDKWKTVVDLFGQAMYADLARSFHQTSQSQAEADSESPTRNAAPES